MNALKEKIKILESLNPDMAQMQLPGLIKVAIETSDAMTDSERKAFFDSFLVEFAERLIKSYMSSPVKRQERDCVLEYIDIIENTTRQLTEKGELEEAHVASKESVALVPSFHYSDTDWCLVQSNANVPKPLYAALDAAERRKRLFCSVLEPLFITMHAFDSEFSQDWALTFLAGFEHLDTDVIRDLLRAWKLQQIALKAEVMDLVLGWNSNEGMRRLWPSITRESDAVLRIQALMIWREDAQEQGSLVQVLRRTYPFRDDVKLKRWLDRALEKLAEHVHYFINCEQAIKESAKNGQKEELDWRRLAAYREVHSMQEFYEPLLILSTLMIDQLGGAVKFARAFLGFTEATQDRWEVAMHKIAMKTVRRFFLLDLKNGNTPEITIKKMCFGDEVLYRRLMGQLDLISHQFDSLEQREKVVDVLACSYASFREEKLLADEISRRYRRFMRLIHEDNLRRVLQSDHFNEFQGEDGRMLVEYASVASAARRFLNTANNMELSVEKQIASKDHFVMEVDKRRRILVKGLSIN